MLCLCVCVCISAFAFSGVYITHTHTCDHGIHEDSRRDHKHWAISMRTEHGVWQTHMPMLLQLVVHGKRLPYGAAATVVWVACTVSLCVHTRQHGVQMTIHQAVLKHAADERRVKKKSHTSDSSQTRDIIIIFIFRLFFSWLLSLSTVSKNFLGSHEKKSLAILIVDTGNSGCNCRSIRRMCSFMSHRNA